VFRDRLQGADAHREGGVSRLRAPPFFFESGFSTSVDTAAIEQAGAVGSGRSGEKPVQAAFIPTTIVGRPGRARGTPTCPAGGGPCGSRGAR